MTRIPPHVLRRYLFGGQVSARGCLKRWGECHQPSATSSSTKRYHETQASQVDPIREPSNTPPIIPFRKQLKDEAKKRKDEGGKKVAKWDNQSLEDWELTVGIEIHAQLNTQQKLFSSAASTINDPPNTRVAFFDVALPGSMPIFRKAALIPAIRAALALNCDVQTKSKFDRKHYFHWDQPSGYQITQYYEPFAKDGYITLYAHDGIAKEDGEEVTIGIKQIQMEQDTAKTISEPGDVHLLDFNRVGLPLIEIITLPQIHYPSTAAALLRKIQLILNSVDACVLGMESGGLRADVNVSVKRRDAEGGDYQYAGITNLGQRTEIKNLSSFKSVEDAIIAERDRQIEVIESGGVIEGETRGWTINSTQTKRLRGKEGEVDYRYMPDPDLGPVYIGQDLIDHLKNTIGALPDEEINLLTKDFGLTVKDAMSLLSLEEGGRYEYFRDVVDEVVKFSDKDLSTVGRICGNWILHEMGGLTHIQAFEENPLQMTPEGQSLISHHNLAQLIHLHMTDKITMKSAKKTLQQLFINAVTSEELKPTEQLIEEMGLWFTPLSEQEYEELARGVVVGEMATVKEILAGKVGKINFLLGKMMRKGTAGSVDPQKAMDVLRKVVDEFKEGGDE
jgi:aspartyl-tRNA(Asn)/glutamyl-tRNA(Gln) amidotransferase subunit B